MDVKTNCLNVEANEEIYMKQPKDMLFLDRKTRYVNLLDPYMV